MLLASGSVRESEADQVALYCQAWADWNDANERLADGVLVKDSRNRVVASPYLAIREQAAEQMVRLGEIIGIRPDSRFVRPSIPLAELMGNG